MSTASAQLEKPPAGDGDTRVYRGRSIDELIPRIEAELGADAIVVRPKRGLEGGIGGFFQRPFVEVEAKPGTPRFDMYDEGMGESVLPPVPRPVGAYVTDTLAPIAAAGSPEPVIEDPPRPSADLPAEFHELTPDTFASALVEAEEALPAAGAPAPTPSPVPDPIGDELELLDREMRDLQVIRPRTPEVSSTPLRGRARLDIEKAMIGVGVSEALTGELIDAAIAHALPFAPRIGLTKAVHGAVVARIPRTPLLPAQSATVAVVGPGGSGKTSCCAALLGAYRRAGVLPSSCASVMFDADLGQPTMLLSPHIMDPTSIGSSRARAVLSDARREGLLLLDMPALSPAERPTIQMVAGLLGELAPDRVVVALPATLGARAADQLLEALRPLGASGL